MTTTMVLGLVILGTMVGLELAVAVLVNPLLRRQATDVELDGRTRGAALLGAAMPFWYLASLTLTVLAAWLGRQGRGGGWFVGSAVGMVLAVALTVGMLVPINNRIARWDARRPPSDWRVHLRRWDTGHAVRVCLIGLAFTALAAGAVTR